MKKRAKHKYETQYGDTFGRTTLAWKTHLGEYMHPHQMKDTHIANIIDMLKHGSSRSRKRLLKFFQAEAKYRGLTRYFLSKAPYSYKDKEGKEWIWVHSLKRALPFGDREYIKMLYE